MSRAMTKTQLVRAATVIYGKDWKRPLAHDLDVAWHTVHRWAMGDVKIPDVVRTSIVGIVALRCLKAGWSKGYVQLEEIAKIVGADKMEAA